MLGLDDDYLASRIASLLKKHGDIFSPEQQIRLQRTTCRWLMPAPSSDSEIKKIIPGSTTAFPTGEWLIHVHPQLGMGLRNSVTRDNRQLPLRPPYIVPAHVVDYIIWHELAHVIQGATSKHSQSFLEIEERFAHREKARKWLMDNGYEVVEDYKK